MPREKLTTDQILKDEGASSPVYEVAQPNRSLLRVSVSNAQLISRAVQVLAKESISILASVSLAF